MDILNEFTIDPIFDDIIDPHKYFENYDLDNKKLNEYITEASKNVNKKNILQRLLDLIKKIFNLVINGIKRLINFIINFIKKPKKTIYGILDKLGIKPKESKSIHESKEDSIKYKTIIIPSNRLSKYRFDNNVKIPINTMKIQFSNNNEDITFTDVNNVPIKGHDGISSSYMGTSLLLVSLHESSILDIIYNIFNTILKINDNNISEKNINEISNIIKSFTDKLVKIFDSVNNGTNKFLNEINKTHELNLKINQLREFNIKLQKTFDLLTKINIDNIIDKINNNSQEFSQNFNRLTSFLVYLNFGVNFLTSSLKEIFMIPEKYLETIGTTETLSKFAEEMIISGFPAKYIMYNVYLISDKKLKGSKGNENAPIWGQSRVVFLPDNEDIVHKIAINGYGKLANVWEERNYNIFKLMKKDYILAPVTSVSENKYCLDMKKAKISDSLGDRFEQQFQIKEELADILNQINENPKYKNKIRINDVHADNIGILNNRLVLIDYAS